MNHMRDVAKMLGIQFGEEFKIDIDPIILSGTYRLTDECLYMVGDNRPTAGTLINLLNGSFEVVKLSKPILTDEEKKYLSLVIEPWKNEIKYMVKIGYDDMEYIMIVFNDLKEMPFPHFKKGKYYKGMERDKEYSVKDLGL